MERKVSTPRWVLLIGLLSAAALWAQDEDADEPDPNAATVEAEEPAAVEPDPNQPAYEDDDDDFRPSEEIPADQSIAFPTDI